MAPEYISFLKARKSYNNIIRMLISEHAANRSEESDEVFLIDHLMHAMKNNPKFAPDTFETELTTLAFASSFSTGIALQWMWVLIDQNRSTVDLIRQVIAEYLLNPMQLDETTKIKAYADLCGNTVVQACIKEVLRMYPPFWFQARKALVDDEFEGIHIKKGTCVLINVVMLHRSINVWKMPNSFDHTRFLDPESQSIPNGAYIPFGGGLRRCPASQMASVEMAVVATMLLDEFDVVIQNPVSLRATKEPDLLMESDQPIRAQIVKRSAIG